MTQASGKRAVTLAGGVDMPLVGLGTWQLRGRRGYEAVRLALEVGYRHVDTATIYGNEVEVGQAVRGSGLDRREVFLTTKLPPEHAGRERQTLAASLKALGTDYVDLWLIHWPPAGQARPGTWRELLAARQEGLARAVGVSNYNPAQLDELTEATGQAPAINQIPWSPFRHDPQLLAAHRKRGIPLEGYSPFRHTNLDEPILREIAARHGVTPAQTVLRWHLEHGIAVIPKSATPQRITSNFDVFDFSLDEEEIARIDSLSSK